jgi:hypothetical protein
MVTVNCMNLWDMMPCGLVDFNRHFEGMYVGRSESKATILFLSFTICFIKTSNMSHCYLKLWLPKPIFQHSVLLNLCERLYAFMVLLIGLCCYWLFTSLFTPPPQPPLLSLPLRFTNVLVVVEVIFKVKSRLHQRPEEWYHEGIQALTSGRA